MSCENGSLIKIYAWPCGVWSNEEEIEEYLSFLSDDYMVLNLSPDLSYAEIDAHVRLAVNGVDMNDVE